jgi:hypothetical protein
MIKAINSIWKNLLFDFIVGITLVILVSYNFFGHSDKHLDLTVADKLSIGAYFLLWLHFLVLVFLVVINIIQKTYFKAIVFLVSSVGLFLGLSFISVFIFVSSFGGPPVDEGNKRKYRESVLCKQFDTIHVKTMVENIRIGIYSSQLDSNLINQIKQDTSAMPKKISKITCGCTTADTTTIIFRLFDNQYGTFDLEMINKNGQWYYTKITQEELNWDD